MVSYDANFYQQVRQQLGQYSNRTLLLDENGNSLSYADVDRQSAQLASYLTDLGIAIGDRISVQVDKSPIVLSLYLACLRAGFVFHPLNPAYQPAELPYFLGNAEPAMLICSSQKRAALEEIAHEAGISHIATLDADGSGSLIEDAQGAAENFVDVPRQVDDLAALLYSSGTTGVPKGIMLTHDNLVANAKTLVDAWGFSEDDILLHALPIFHVHGLFVAFGCVLLSGASMRWMNNYNPQAVIKNLPDSTVMMGVPTYYTRLLDDANLNADSCRNMRLFISGSAPLLEETFIEFEQRTGHKILERYGMSETNMNTSNPLHGERRAGTVGPALADVELRVVDENNASLATGEIGNLQVKGPNVFKGYWKMPDKTVGDFTEDGYFNTGDKAKIDADGYVSIVGRSKDLIITGGLNVYPKEVELLIDDMPSIKESAVIGVKHADFGEGVVAVVVAQKDQQIDEAKIIADLKRLLADFKVPKKLVVVNELPRNTMGKVQKNSLRETYADLLSA